MAANTCHADNGQVALAFPISDVIIDGDLEDWPAGMTVHPISLDYFGNEEINKDDFWASYRVGYNVENQSIYLAVEVQDESEFADSENPWNQQDSAIAYIDPSHSPHGSGYWLFRRAA